MAKKYYPRSISGKRKGIVLILSLAIVAILAAIVLEFNYTSRVELDIAGNFINVLKAECLAKSAINIAIFLLRKDEDLSIDSLNEEWAKQFPPLPISGGKVTLKITDENRKININQIKDKKEVKHQIERLLNLIGEEKNILKNAEKKIPYETIEQFAREKTPLLANYLTVFGKGKVNINTANKEVIKSLSPLIDEDLAQRIVNFREKHPFKDIVQLSPAYEYAKPEGLSGEIYRQINDFITVRSEVFLIQAVAQVNDTIKQIQAVVQRKGRVCKFLYYKVNNG